MITFKSNKHIDETKLNKIESEYFILFLLDERHRHVIAQKICDEKRDLYRNLPILPIAYQTSISEHLIDIRYIDKTIVFLKKKHNLNDPPL